VSPSGGATPRGARGGAGARYRDENPAHFGLEIFA
jgi:hypothetical protein